VLARTGAPSPFLAELTGEAPRLPPPSPNGSRRAGGNGGSGDGPDDRGRPGRAGARGRGRGTGGGRSADGAGDELDPPAAARFDALREWRRQQATEDGVPAYVVLHDRHLKGIARVDPRTLDELAACDGIGPTKLDRYGDAVLAVLTDLADRTASEQPSTDDDDP
jgi:superfamily II DNA helicase RecQ